MAYGRTWRRVSATTIRTDYATTPERAEMLTGILPDGVCLSTALDVAVDDLLSRAEGAGGDMMMNMLRDRELARRGGR